MSASQHHGPEAVPRQFQRAVQQLTQLQPRPELRFEKMPAPTRIAPFAASLMADLVSAPEINGTGRFVLLHDPAGNDLWDGTFRCVIYVRCDIEPEFITDPFLAEVGWSWLIEGLARHQAEYDAIAGTVTSVASESFGGMSNEPSNAQVEVRASWTQRDEEVAGHVAAWGDLLCMAAGIAPVPDGVITLPSRRD